VAYVSPWLTHFVGRRLKTPDQLKTYDAQCRLLIDILSGRRLGQWKRQGNFVIDPAAMNVGSGSICKDEFILHNPVCFCDIPQNELKRHIAHYSPFGLAFTKAFLLQQGANPVFYVAKGSVTNPPSVYDFDSDPQVAVEMLSMAQQTPYVAVKRCEFFDELVSNLRRVFPPPWPPGTPGDAVDPYRDIQRRVAMDLFRHVFAFTKLFDESLPQDHPDNFYMEREWRVAGFVRFELSDIQLVYVPPGYAQRIRERFPALPVEEISFELS
jgi:hypothetical protein